MNIIITTKKQFYDVSVKAHNFEQFPLLACDTFSTVLICGYCHGFKWVH